MSDLIFPELRGREWSVTRSPVWSTLVQEAASGHEVRVGLWATPRWKWSVSHVVLRTFASYQELQKLTGFLLSLQGRLYPFLYKDRNDYTVTGQAIATGDGSTKSFQMVRTAGISGTGTFTESVKAVEATDPAPVIYVAGVEQESGWTIGSTGLLTFTTAPASGAAITADFDFYWRCRLQEDEIEFENFSLNRWKADSIAFISLK